jgi:hypothetical protein
VQLYFSVVVGMRIYKCLTGSYCGPGIANGWLYLALLGVSYLGFEICSYLLRRWMARKSKQVFDFNRGRLRGSKRPQLKLHWMCIFQQPE